MKPRQPGTRLAAALILLGLALAIGSFAAQQPRATLADADRFYAEKSYASAGPIYERLLKEGAVPAERRDEARYRLAVSLGKMRQADRALETSLDFVKTHRGTVWEPRGLYWLGQLFLGVPHQGYRVGARLHRGDDVPQSDTAEVPQRVDILQQDFQNAHDALEAARVFFPAYRSEGHTEAEEIQLDFDLVGALRSDRRLYKWLQKGTWPSPADPVWHIDPMAVYDPAWPTPKKTLYLFAQIQALAGRMEEGHHSAALGLLGKSLWLSQYHATMRSVTQQWRGRRILHRPYPYQDLNAEEPLRQLIHDFPDDPVRDQAQFTLALYAEQNDNFRAAEAAFHRLIRERPGSKWVQDARFHLQEITRRAVTVESLGPQMPGQTVRVRIGTRNVRRLHFAVYPVKLEDFIGRDDVLNNPARSLNSFYDLMRHPQNAPKSFGPALAEWDLTTRDNGDHRYRSETVAVPVHDVGAYAVVASAEGARTANVVVVTDLALVQELHRDGALFFAADARTGQPVPGAKIIAKQWWYEQPQGANHCAGTTAETADGGLANVPLLRAAGRNNFRVAAFASLGRRYALTEPVYNWDNGDNPEIVKVYSTTDRAVYRPQQTVHFRTLVLRRQQGDLKPIVDRQVRVQVFDPKGQTLYDRTMASGEFGTVHGEFALLADVPLGEYYVSITLPGSIDSPTEYGGNRFRVEEYKKPEFEVTVTPDADRVILGQPATAHIGARYYFGGPVPGAKVTYRVYSDGYFQTYRFPRPFDFLFNYAVNGDYNANYRNGEVVAQGEARLDAKGDAKITFATASPPVPAWAGFGGFGSGGFGRWAGDVRYIIEADVQDASRRVISGMGTVKATRHDVAVFVDYPHGYASKGDRVDVEIMTLDPADKPVSVSGTARVLRQPMRPRGKKTVVFQQPLKTDDHGRAYLHWTATQAGFYQVAFTTRDRAEQEITGATSVWVAGSDLQPDFFHTQNVFLAVQNPYYEEGQSARVLLLTPHAGSTVLLTREANNEILDKQVLRVDGRSLELTIPLDHKDVPNVFLSAVVVYDGRMYQATQELFVPPVRQLTTVSVQADKERYQPGEKARLRLAARDWQGRPLRTELSVSVSDAALGYIQKDYAPDIRAYYYGNRRSLSIQMNGSSYARFIPDVEDTQPRESFQTHEWRLPEGMGQIADWPGYDSLGYYGNGLYSGPYGPFGAFGPPGMTPEFRGGFGMGGFGGGGGGLGDMMSGGPAGPIGDLPLVGNLFSSAGSRQTMMRTHFSTGHLDQGATLAEPALRTRFEDTAFWTPAVVTDAQGDATVEVTWPDNLTQWRAHAVGTTTAAQVGTGETSVTTRKDLLVRLEAPRFFVERDTVVLSANVHNYTASDSRVRVRLDLGGDAAEIAGLPPGPASLVSTQIRLSRTNAPMPQIPNCRGGVPPPANGSEGTTDGPTRSVCPYAEGGRHRDTKRAAPVSPPYTGGCFSVGTRDECARSARERSSGKGGGGLGESWIDLPKDSEKRVDWTVHVRHEGTLRVRMTAQSDNAADATEMTFPVLVHGVERMLAQSGALRDQTRAELAVDLPQARKPGSSELVVQLNPSLAAVMLDALPYLADYPYGCIEQTMSRFLPGVVVAKTLKDSGYDLEDLRKRARLLAERAAAGDGRKAIDNSAYTYPHGRPGSVSTVVPAFTPPRWHSPVFDRATLDEMVAQGLARIRRWQHGDGGWGWWPDDTSDPYMTAYVLYGLITARSAGYTLDDSILNRGLSYLQGRFVEDDNFHRMAYEARVLSMDPRYQTAVLVQADRLFTNRERLSAYSKALLALAFQNIGRHDRAAVLLRNIETTATVDDANGTASWDGSDRCWWCWWNDKTETNAAVLQAYMAIQPDAKLPAMLVKWLVNNRRGSSWYSTRETAMAVYALADYARVNHELAPEYTLTVDFAGRAQRKYTVNRENALFFDNQFVVPDDLLQAGKQPLTITKEGHGSLYYAAYTRYFSLEEPIKATGNEIFVERHYYRLLPGTAAGAPTQPLPRDSFTGALIRRDSLAGALIPLDADRPNPFLTGRYSALSSGGEWIGYQDPNNGPRYDRVPVREGEVVKSGDLLEVDLQLESKNDYDYLVFEDMKPAGCEPVDLRSGYHTGLGVCSNMELRDQKVAFFITSMPQGTRRLSYRLRAEIPGQFHALPTNGYAMYAPDVRTLSDEMRFGIRDEQPEISMR